MATKSPAKKAAESSGSGNASASRAKPAVESASRKTNKSASAKADSGVKQASHYHGSCHCGRIVFDVEGTIDQVMDCNCSLCKKRGGLLWFIPRSAMRLVSPESALWTYTFNKHVLQHHFCANCGIAPFSEGEKKGEKMAAINVRCLDDVDLSKLKVVQYDGRSA